MSNKPASSLLTQGLLELLTPQARESLAQSIVIEQDRVYSNEFDPDSPFVHQHFSKGNDERWEGFKFPYPSDHNPEDIIFCRVDMQIPLIRLKCGKQFSKINIRIALMRSCRCQ